MRIGTAKLFPNRKPKLRGNTYKNSQRWMVCESTRSMTSKVSLHWCSLYLLVYINQTSFSFFCYYSACVWCQCVGVYVSVINVTVYVWRSEDNTVGSVLFIFTQVLGIEYFSSCTCTISIRSHRQNKILVSGERLRLAWAMKALFQEN